MTNQPQIAAHGSGRAGVSATGPAVRVGIVGDNRLFCEGLGRIIATDPEFGLVGDVGAVPTLEFLRGTTAEILVADARLDGWMPLCRELRRSEARPWVILVAGDTDEDWVVRALETGARGVLSKSATAETLLKAIHAVHAGEIWASKAAIARIVEALARRANETRSAEHLFTDRLSQREHEIVRHTAEGLSNQEVADRLRISEATVKAHLTRIFQKLGVRDRAQLLALYHRSGSSRSS